MSENGRNAKRSRRSERRETEQSQSSKRAKTTNENIDDEENEDEWTNHQMTEDYVSLASRMMLYPLSQKLGPFGYTKTDQPSCNPYPLEHMSALAYLKSAVRRPSVVEQWSPFDIAVFEAAIATHGKEFFRIQKEIPSKTTKDVIEFYYVWKVTKSGRKWKNDYISPHFDPTEAADDEKAECHIAD